MPITLTPISPPSRICALAALLLSSAAVFAQTYTFTTVAGPPSLHGSADGAGSSAAFYYPDSIAVDAAGNIFVADTFNHTLRKLTPAGVVSTLAGRAGVAGSADGAGAGALFDRPFGLALDSSGNIFLADSRNHTIRKITPTGVVSTFAGLAGAVGSTDGTGSAARFNGPQGLAIDSANNLYIADRSNRTIRKISPAGVVSTFAGFAGVGGSVDGVGSNARFALPTGIAVNSSGTLFVADAGDQTIRKITPAGAVTTFAGLSNAAGSASGVGAAARFNHPSGLALDSAGTLYVADSFNNCIRKIAPDATVTLFAGSTSRGNTNATGAFAKFYAPMSVAVDATGNVFVADSSNHSIRKITAAGVVSLFAGNGGSFGSADGVGAAARFKLPNGIARDAAGNLYVADTGSFTLRKISPDGRVSTFAGLADARGYVDATGPAARFTIPSGVAIAAADMILVTELFYNNVRQISPNADVRTRAGSLAGTAGSSDGAANVASFFGPYGIATDSAGNAFVADAFNHLIRRIDGVTFAVTTIAGLAGASGSNDGVGASARFNTPCGIAVDSAGTLYIADTGNQLIRKITSGGVVSTLAGIAGTGGTKDGAGGVALFLNPYALAVDAAGNVFVADTDNSLIRKITPSGTVSTIGGSATASLDHVDGIGTNALFIAPSGLVVDASGVLYIVDGGGNSIVKGVPDFSGQPQTITAMLGSTVTLSAAATEGGLSFQWNFDGVPIAGATNSTYTLTVTSSNAAGTYTVVVANASGTVTNNVATLVVVQPGHLINLSVLTTLTTSGELLTVGTVIGGHATSGAKPLLVRTAGPSLTQFGVPNVLPDPQMSLIPRGASTALASNNNWGGGVALANAFAQVGAFAYTAGNSNDAALLQPNLAPGDYTVQVSDTGSGTGAVIAELYDATPSASYSLATPRLINVSVLKNISGGLTVGFVIGGNTSMKVLIRAVGPTIGAPPFNVPGTMADPKIDLFRGQTVIASNDDWGGGATLSTAFSSAGAFALGATSKDAALVITLQPGDYTAQVSGVNGGTGVALVEIYEAP